MNLVEFWHSMIERQASTAEPSRRQRRQHYDPRVHRQRPPFVWTTTAEQALTKSQVSTDLKRRGPANRITTAAFNAVATPV
jgi:hypothetical protein